MKKINLFFAFVLMTSACLISSCKGGDDPTGGLLDDPKGTMDVLSPDEQKNFLVDVGEELMNTFNPNDQKEAVELAD